MNTKHTQDFQIDSSELRLIERQARTMQAAALVEFIAAVGHSLVRPFRRATPDGKSTA